MIQPHKGDHLTVHLVAMLWPQLLVALRKADCQAWDQKVRAFAISVGDPPRRLPHLLQSCATWSKNYFKQKKNYRLLKKNGRVQRRDLSEMRHNWINYWSGLTQTILKLSLPACHHDLQIKLQMMMMMTGLTQMSSVLCQLVSYSLCQVINSSNTCDIFEMILVFIFLSSRINIMVVFVCFNFLSDGKIGMTNYLWQFLFIRNFCSKY